jgi:acyl carrier protein
VLPCAAMRQEAVETPEAQVERLVREYSQSAPQEGPLSLRLSLRDDLAIESLTLVSLAVQLGTELGVDVVDVGLELGEVRTLGDLVRVARGISDSRSV